MKGIEGFARSIVKGQSRVPYPAARIIARIFRLQRLTFHRRVHVKLSVELSTRERVRRKTRAPRCPWLNCLREQKCHSPRPPQTPETRAEGHGMRRAPRGATLAKGFG